MMRVIFLLLVSSIALQSKSQTWNNYLQKRFKSYGIWADSVLLLPSDTTINKAAKSLAVKNGNLYIANGTYWTEISGGSSVVDSLDKLYLKLTGGIVTGTVDIQQPLSLGEGEISRGRLNFFNEDNGNTGSLSSIPYTSNREWFLPDYDGTLTTEDSLRSKTDSLLNIINGRATFGDVRDIVHDTANVLVRIADSAAMLNPYLRKVDTAEFVKKTRTLTIGKNGSATDLSDDRVFLDSVPNINTTNATNITSGTLDDARLSSNVPLKNTANTFTENQTISKSNPQVELVSATTAKASLLRGETTNTFSLTNDVLEIGGALSNCISFNNANQYIGSSPTGITGVTQWTVSFWINRTTQTSTNVIYFGDGTNNYQITICCGGTGYLGVYYNGTINNWFTTNVVATSGWQHFVVTKDTSNILRIYINGALNNTPIYAITNISNISSFRIGNVTGLPNTVNQNAPTSQKIDQVLLYNTSLSLANVQSIYASGTGTTTLPSTGNLLLRYELNEGTGTTTVNQGTASTGNGTLVNGVIWNIATGKIPTEAATQLGTALQVIDGVLSGERGQYRFGDPFGGTILRGRSIKFQVPLETQFSFIHDGTSTLIDPANTNTSATGASTVSVVGNASIGENVAAPTNGLRVKGNGLFQANTFFGGTTTPTARVHVLASSTSASGGQIKLIGGGSAQTVTEDGTINYIGNNLEFAQSTTVYKLAKTLQNSATLDFGSTASLSTTTLTITVTGVADGDQVSLGVPNGSMTAGLIYFAWVSAADTVSIQCYNSTLGAIDPASGTFKISVIKQ